VARLVYRGERADLKDANTVRQFQALTAACLLVRKSAFMLVEGFDERYWNGYEDVDLCFKLRERNLKLLYQPASVVIHHESQSGPERFAKAQENILRLHQKWLGKIQPDLVIKESGEVVAPASKTLSQTSSSTLSRSDDKAANSDKVYDKVCGEESWKGVSQPVLDRSRASKVSIVVLTLNNLPLTRQCLESIERHTARERYELIVVDNGSSDGTLDYLRQLQKQHEHIRVIANKTNRGFAAGNNQGISITRSNAILLLNNDTVVTAGWLERLLGVLEQYPDVGLVGPISNCVSGPQQISEPGYEDLSELPAFASTGRTRWPGNRWRLPVWWAFVSWRGERSLNASADWTSSSAAAILKMTIFVSGRSPLDSKRASLRTHLFTMPEARLSKLRKSTVAGPC